MVYGVSAWNDPVVISVAKLASLRGKSCFPVYAQTTPVQKEVLE